MSFRLPAFAALLGALALGLSLLPAPARAGAGEAGLRVDGRERIELREALRWCRGQPFDARPPAVCAQGWHGPGELNAGYDARPLWIAVPLANPGPPRRRWLEIGYPSLDRVTVFAPAVGAEPGERLATLGDLEPFDARPLPHRSLVVPLTVPTGESRLWLRVESAGTLTVPLTLWQPAAFLRHGQALYALLAAYFGLVGGLALFYFLLGLGLRDGDFLVYALHALSLALGLAAQSGFGSEFLWPSQPWLSNLLLPVGMQAATGLGAWFVLRFLGLHRRPGLHRVALRALVFACFGLGIPALLLGLPGAWPFVSVTALLFALIGLSAGIAAVRRGVPAAWPFLLAFFMLLLGALLTGLRNLGLVPTNGLTANALQIGSALELLLLAVALAARFVALRRAHAEGQAQLLALQQRALADAEAAEAALEARVAERTAELAAANERLREREAQLKAMAQRDALTGVANRLALRPALEALLADWRRGGPGFAVLLLDLDGFKPVNDRHGHAVGDRVLVEIAARLSGAVRSGDVVARHGGDEFVLVLAGTVEPAELEARVQEIARRVEAPIPLEGEVAVVRASIGIAQPAHSADTVDALLRRADLAMYAAKAGGSGRWSHAPALAG
ncbi:diguanylate cyclase [Silanimonas lenta]|uniref:diguanylate cyclase n=1 Tax=Silanimonas lenta TaxID=265429 RepID=UPI00041FA0F4|nr:diguanylate cyclase [Silanimonas lenta]